MDADHIMCVSELTRQIVINKYHQNPAKVSVMHNAVTPLSQRIVDLEVQKRTNEKNCKHFRKILCEEDQNTLWKLRISA